ncbi:MAG TPA: DUF1236 domain-containing protein [Hyphomicrobiaceae bacterium]|nr:DUF1236 domain-containing protein [Hyphomicrobiaceae bacterium]
MMKFALLGSVAAAALLCAAPMATAQAPERHEQSTPAMKSESQGQAPGKAERGASKTQTSPGASERSEGSKQDRTHTAQPGADQRGQPAEKMAKDKDQNQSQAKGTQKSGEPSTAQKKATENNKSAEQPTDTSKTKSKSAQDRSGNEKSKQAEQPSDRSKERSKAAQDKSGAGQSKSAAEENRGGSEKRVQVSEEKRSGVRDRLLKSSKVKKTKIDVSVSVGVTIPRSVHLYSLPPTLISYAPAYRGYDYVVLEDETILIVNPRTYVVVDVLPAGTQRAERPTKGRLALSSSDMHFVYEAVPKSRRSDVRVRLALGANVPRNVTLLAFPREVLQRLPDLRSYRFIVSGSDVVIVDPDSRDVALVISE